MSISSPHHHRFSTAQVIFRIFSSSLHCTIGYGLAWWDGVSSTLLPQMKQNSVADVLERVVLMPEVFKSSFRFSYIITHLIRNVPAGADVLIGILSRKMQEWGSKMCKFSFRSYVFPSSFWTDWSLGPKWKFQSLRCQLVCIPIHLPERFLNEEKA